MRLDLPAGILKEVLQCLKYLRLAQFEGSRQSNGLNFDRDVIVVEALEEGGEQVWRHQVKVVELRGWLCRIVNELCTNVYTRALATCTLLIHVYI